jgi:hypothetical protein
MYPTIHYIMANFPLHLSNFLPPPTLPPPIPHFWANAVGRKSESSKQEKKVPSPSPSPFSAWLGSCVCAGQAYRCLSPLLEVHSTAPLIGWGHVATGKKDDILQLKRSFSPRLPRKAPSLLNWLTPPGDGFHHRVSDWLLITPHWFDWS